MTNVRILDLAGHEVDAKRAKQHLVNPTSVLIAADEKKLDPLYQRIYKKDTLVLYLPKSEQDPLTITVGQSSQNQGQRRAASDNPFAPQRSSQMLGLAFK